MKTKQSQAEKLVHKEKFEKLERQYRNELPEFFHTFKNTFPKLTPLETVICAMITKNMTCEVIGGLLGSAPGTIQGHRSKIRKKLHLKKGEDLRTFLLDI